MSDATNNAWHIFTGQSRPHLAKLPDAPPWRQFAGEIPGGKDANDEANQADEAHQPDDPYWHRAVTYKTPAAALDAINAALMLRRPLLVTGKPGTGKSSLAYRVAYELGLGPVLEWQINSRSSLKDGLYGYDAIGRLNDKNLGEGQGGNKAKDIGSYINLRALGTALLPSARPRVLLIDELDKADPDLPNDLLNVFEGGWFEIPELQRHTESVVKVSVMPTPADKDQTPAQVEVKKGRVVCAAFPFIVMTSNGERDFSPAFLRRCIRLDLAEPDEEQLIAIVTAHLGNKLTDDAKARIKSFADNQIANKDKKTTATDQLLNALFVIHAVTGNAPVSAAASEQYKELYNMLTQPLD